MNESITDNQSVHHRILNNQHSSHPSILPSSHPVSHHSANHQASQQSISQLSSLLANQLAIIQPTTQPANHSISQLDSCQSVSQSRYQSICHPIRQLVSQQLCLFVGKRAIQEELLLTRTLNFCHGVYDGSFPPWFSHDV